VAGVISVDGDAALSFITKGIPSDFTAIHSSPNHIIV
jgi:hypothetical protein